MFCSSLCKGRNKIKEIKKDTVLYEKFVKLDRERKHKYRFGMRDVSIIFKKFNGKCNDCGNVAEVIHHIDGNGNPKNKKTLNNNIDNLLPLCRSCHFYRHFRKII